MYVSSWAGFRRAGAVTRELEISVRNRVRKYGCMVAAFRLRIRRQLIINAHYRLEVGWPFRRTYG